MHGFDAIELDRSYAHMFGPRVLLIPGWIGRGRDRNGSPSQYRPFFGWAFAHFTSHWCIDFKQGVQQEAAVSAMSRAIEMLTRRTSKLSIVASSYGAMMLIRALARAKIDRALVNAVLVDPPAGATSLVKLKQFRAAGLGKKIGQLPTWLNDGFAQATFDKLFCPGLADSDPIEVPAAVQAKGATEVERYIAEVRKDSFDGQQGFPLTLCMSQIGEMARAADDPAYQRACFDVDWKFTTNVTRIISTRDNQVVDPGVSDPFYSLHMPSVNRVEAKTNHCDYAQRREFWNELLMPLL